MNLRSSSLALAALLTLAALPACSGPRAAGRTATAAPAPAKPADAFSGSWAGTWHSDATGHHGKLFCEFSRLDARHHRAEFTAHWGLLHGSYSVVMDTRRAGRDLRFQGRQDLGALYGGVYTYDGKVSPARFFSKYSAASDHGTFDLQRATPKR
jgi:hypothetical protein